MAYTRSARDILSELAAQVKRDLSDIQIDHLGTESQVLRIELGEMDVIGYRDETLVTQLITNTIIMHPMGNKQWLFNTMNSDNQLETDAVNIWEILPIRMKIKYSSNYSLDTDPVAIKKGDMIIELLRDEHDTAIPVIYQVTKLMGGFQGKYLYQKEYELALYRGEIPHDIQNAIDKFIANEEIQTSTVRQGSHITKVTYNETLNVLDSFKASENILKYRAVIVDSDELVYYADSSIVSHASRVIGITISPVNLGGNVRIQTFGELRDTSWNWSLTAPIFLGIDGGLTQVSPTTGFSLVIAKVISKDTIFINIQQPIVL
jgi:hypothetical protein